MSPSQSSDLPRKIVVGTAMQPYWGEYPGLEARLAQLAALIDRMADEAARRYDGAGLDVAALPEVAVNGGLNGVGDEVSFPLDGPVLEALGGAARRHRCYVVVPMYLTETELSGGTAGTYSNAAVLLDRDGEIAGIYRKVHAVPVGPRRVMEGGVLPGSTFPVFDCDFGRLGIQICYDMVYDDGWAALDRKGAELVVWTTQSPGQIKASARAHRHRYFVLTSTWRNNASLFDPTGAMIREISQARGEGPVFVEQIDLSYVLLGWQPALGNGAAFDEAFGDRAGYRYSEAEDGGIFWSNDPATPIMDMVRQLKLELPDERIAADGVLQDVARGGPPAAE
ncbi:MAG: carbon-nitrogen hydrolase family protein [Planctomycetes bacterium]|nr:carbon-nitrogen hydrolase family protein [Planctomycetota bacterium]